MYSQVHFDHIYSSPLVRALDTAYAVRKSTHVKICNDIKELDTGSVSHIKLTDLWARDGRFRTPWLFPDMRYPDGETFCEMTARITRWYSIEKTNWKSNERILIVGHEGTLRTMYMNFNGLQLKEYPDFPISNCDTLWFETSEDKVEAFKHIVLETDNGAP